MRYENLENAGELRIEITGSPLDAYTLGIVQTNVQDIIDKASFWLLSEAGIIEPTWKRPKYLPERVPSPYRRVVRAEIRKIGAGSLYETLSFAVNSVLANQNTIAVLQNLVASIIWAISASSIKGIASKSEPPPFNVHPPLLKRKDPIEIAPNLIEMLMAIAENSEGKSVDLKFIHEKSGEERMEVTIKVGNNN